MDKLVDNSLAGENNGYMVFDKLKDMTYYIKSIGFPGIQTDKTTLNLPIKANFSIPSTISRYDDMNITWICDENYKTYFMIYKWMMEYKKVVNNKDMVSDASIILTNNNKNPIIRVHLIDSWPTSLNSFNLNSVSAEPISCTMSLAYHYYEIEYLDQSLSIL